VSPPPVHPTERIIKAWHRRKYKHKINHRGEAEDEASDVEEESAGSRDLGQEEAAAVAAWVMGSEGPAALLEQGARVGAAVHEAAAGRRAVEAAERDATEPAGVTVVKQATVKTQRVVVQREHAAVETAAEALLALGMGVADSAAAADSGSADSCMTDAPWPYAERRPRPCTR
jgi:hypothetical protein